MKRGSERGFTREGYLGLATLLFFLAAAALAYFRPFAPASAGDSRLPLQVTESGGRIRVDWDPALPPVRRADAGMLSVVDGGVAHEYPMERRVIRSGSFDYVRRSDDVLLTVTLHEQNRRIAEAMVRSVGPPPLSIPSIRGEPPTRAKPAPRKRARQSRTRRR